MTGELMTERLSDWGPCVECGATTPFGPTGHKPDCTVAYPYGSPPDLLIHGGGPDPHLETSIVGLNTVATREDSVEGPHR